MAKNPKAPQGPQGPFKDKNILITGANGLLGRELAKQLAMEGANLILLGRNMSALNELASELHKKYSTNCITYKLDLSSENPVTYKKLGVYLEKNIRSLDTVILNAAHKGEPLSLLNYPQRMWKNLMQINLDANITLSQSLLPLLLKAPKPALIFTLVEENSNQSCLYSAYLSAKGGLRAFMQTMSKEFSDSHLTIFGTEPCLMSEKDPDTGQNEEDLAKSTQSVRDTARRYILAIQNFTKERHGKVIRLG